MKTIPCQKVLDFWFNPDNEPFWFQKNEQFDQQIKEYFYDVWLAGRQGLLANWRDTIQGRLAEIIVLDQFSRNLNRDNAASFAQDGIALVLAQEAVKDPKFSTLPESRKKFILMPFMHSESSSIHEQGLPLFEALGDALTLEFELKHKAIIDKFGRYPHRNETLNRQSTSEELEFLKQPDSSF
ncbi:DUF924 family protein [Acetobacterium bakii]|uniref:Membrane protein n=1 Tax=Acetobacterium bakii TaxID=52689 RepID=A0A0L6U2J2_9FIRM|nr:DUF924 family protein [Acetobacterium bakii]KNZ42733.1 membrane protein [Acetobacterium bakii]